VANSARQILYRLHLAPMKEPTESPFEGSSGRRETITAEDGTFLLTPMSEVAGRMGFKRARTTGEPRRLGWWASPRRSRGEIDHRGGAGPNAVKMAVGLGAHVTVLDKSLECSN
jgi:alanine dehydrogenase